jgi:ribonuclease HII
MKKGALESFKEPGSQGELAFDSEVPAGALSNVFFEDHYSKKGYKNIAGVDEAGRGPLAGPVVAAAVILPKRFHVDSINDSKKLTEKKRIELFDIIHGSASAIGIGIVYEQEIDRLNILNASLLAMQTALSELDKEPDFILVDGNVKVCTAIPQKTIRKGDSKSISIAAASIIAKVTRDRIMYQHHRTYPYYNFKSHKGYGTKEHIEAIKKYGITKIHRRTFSPVKEIIDERQI